MAKFGKVEECSCEETEFLRIALQAIHEACEDGDAVDASRFHVVELSSEALGDPEPGGEPPCSCDEAIELRRALRACFNVCQAEGQTPHAADEGWFGACDDLAQANNFATQGLGLEPLTGDPGVYTVAKFVPRADQTKLLYMGAARAAVGLLTE